MNLTAEQAFEKIKPLREKGMTDQRIAEKLWQDGYRTRSGKRWNAHRVERVYTKFITKKSQQ